MEASSLKPWQEQIVQHIKVGRLRYLQRIAVVCAALEPRALPSLLAAREQTSTSESSDLVVHKYGRLYIPNPFMLPHLHACVVCVRRRSLTLKRILSALGAGDLSGLLDKDDVPTNVPLLPFILSCVYVHLVLAKGEAASDIESVLRTASQYKSLAKYGTAGVSHTALIEAVLTRTLRFTEPVTEPVLEPVTKPVPDAASTTLTEPTPLSLHFNELFESVFLERWTTVHTAKALMESLQGVVGKSVSVELNIGKDQPIPSSTSPEAWAEHVGTCFDIIREYQLRSPSIVISHLKHLYQLHHTTSPRKGPRGYFSWWEIDRNRRISLLAQILQRTCNENDGFLHTSNVEIVKYIFLLLVGWAYQQQPHKFLQLQRKQNKGGVTTNPLLDDEAARLIKQTTEAAKSVISLKDANLVNSLAFQFLAVGVLLPYDDSLARNSFLFIIDLLQDDAWADYLTNHPRSSEILIHFAEFLAALRTPSDLSIATRSLLTLWRTWVPSFNDGMLIHTVFKVASASVFQSEPAAHELDTWYSTISSIIQELFMASHNDSVLFTSLYAASGMLKGLPSKTHPHIYILLQGVIMTALHRLDSNAQPAYIWKSAVAFALAHSGLCSKNTTLDMEHDAPKALELLVQVIVSDVFGGWIFGTSPDINQGSSPGEGFNIALTPTRAHAHAKTALYASSSAFTSAIARLFTALPLGHPSRDTTILQLWSYAKVLYEAWREFAHRTEASYTDSSVVTTSILPIVQVVHLAVTLFCFYATQTLSPPRKATLPEIPVDMHTSNAQVEIAGDPKKLGGISSKHAVEIIDALGYLEFAGADVPRFYVKLANLFLSDPATLEENIKELIYRIPIPISAYASFHPVRDSPQLAQSTPLPPTKDGKALLARVAFLLRVIEPLAPLVDSDTLTNRLIPVSFALLSHASEQVRRSAHAVIHSLLTSAPVPLAQTLVPSYCRIALASALVDDVPVAPSSNNSQIADYLYESMAAIFRRMSPPIALIAVKALASAAMNAVVSSSDGIQHKKLVLLLLSQAVVQVDISILDITLSEIDKIVRAATSEYKYTLLTFLHRVVTRNVDYTRKTRLASWFLLQVRDAKLD